MEIIDYYDEHERLIGSIKKDKAHQLGLWHKVFGCLFINSKKNTVYMQYKNNKHNDLSNLNKVDISVGGHLKSKETIKDGVREIKEESSLNIKYEQLEFIKKRIVNVKINANYIIREFCYMYLLNQEFNLEELKSIDDEVLYFIEFDIDELINFLTSDEQTIIGNTINGKQEFKKENFIKAYIEEDHYYLQYLNYAKKMIK